jgi:bifunctional oligoribonuclease and PAP phosphatase NrnA
MDEAQFAAVAQQLQKAQRLMVVSHIHPDGDAIGSLLGLGLTLQEAGKQVIMASTDGVPANYKFLAGVDQVVSSPQGDFDAIVAVDCSDLSRLGKILGGYDPPDVNIDHHVTNDNFARVNLVVPQAVATAEILAVLLPSVGFPLTQPAARALLTGLVTDTLGFRTANMTSKALRVAADLLEFGIDLPEIFQNTLVQHSYEAVRYWATGLNRIERCGGLAWTSLTLEDRKAVGYPGRDDADLITLLSSITDIDIAIIFVEQVRNRIKVSWRARPGLDVARIALSFGGGGHPAAAGAEIHGALPDVQERVLKATQMIEK